MDKGHEGHEGVFLSVQGLFPIHFVLFEGCNQSSVMLDVAI